MTEYDIIEDRLNGLTFKAIKNKYDLRHETQARDHYVNSLIELIKMSPKLQKGIKKEIEVIRSLRKS